MILFDAFQECHHGTTPVTCCTRGTGQAVLQRRPACSGPSQIISFFQLVMLYARTKLLVTSLVALEEDEAAAAVGR
jgi:hypothetical protein